jgi:transcription elongation factor Elf1
MSDGILFTCKQCGSQSVKIPEPGEQDEPLDAICTNCGAPFTNDDALAQMRAELDKALAPHKQTKVFNIGRKK